MKMDRAWKRALCWWIATMSLLTVLSGCGKDKQTRMMEQLDLGNRYLSELNYQEASIAFERAIAIEDRNTDAWMGFAQANVGLAEDNESAEAKAYYDAAEAAYLRVMELEPARTESWLELARLYESTGRTEQAIALLEEALGKADQREQVEQMLSELRQNHPGTVMVKLTSQTSPGEPVANAAVALENGSELFSGTTDDNGVFQQQIPAGTYVLTVRDGEEEVFRQDISISPDVTLELGEIEVATVPDGNVEEQDGQQLYAPILNLFYQWLSTGEWNEDDMYYGLRNAWGDDWGEADEASYLWSRYYSDGVKGAGYCFQDLNQDGVPELLVSPVEAAQRGTIYDLFTCIDGSIVHLCASGERDLFSLCENETVGEDGSGGAMLHAWSYYTLPNGATDLKLTEEVQYNGDRDSANPWFYTNQPRFVTTQWGETLDDACFISVTEAEANEIIDGHGSVPFEVSTFDQYLQEQ